jgi:hypothetical protein
MNTQPPAKLPITLSGARHQLDRWRRRHRPHTRLPKEFWEQAVALAGQHGVSRTSTALGLKYDSLKKHLAAATGPASNGREQRCEFLELRPPSLAVSPMECTMEWEEAEGVKTRMHIKGLGMEELMSLVGRMRSGRA